MTTYRLRSGARSFYMGMGAFSGGFGLLMLWAVSMRWYDMGPDEVFLASVGCLFLLLGVWCFYGVPSRALMQELANRTERPLEELPREEVGACLKRSAG